ncbi:hypothetical protein B0I35DRAFT_474211 [Stachybotrys elegans]|uniref:Nap family protein n=1 Tax=Stachybotrys elegans TaxID=80388 RepID=A0A8K0T9F6_9HYPO|nr:hypothetical protein B0I35DRAFT_474211 [Stachybotrys elegans]
MSADGAIEIDPQALRELELLDASLQEIESEIMAKKCIQQAPVLIQRQQTIDKIPGFWAVVFDNAAVELEAAITAQDSEILANALVRLEVLRPEIPAGASHTDSGLDKFGEPRTITINFHFKENEWFTDSVLSKTLYFRHSLDGSTGLVSDPIKINWKPGKDLTEGLTDAAYELWAAQKQLPSQQLDGVLNQEARKARDLEAKSLPQYKNLEKTIEEKINGALSFFNFFSYRGRWTSAAENAEALAKTRARRAAALAGKPVEDEEDDDDDFDFAEEAVESFPPGHEVAVTIAEDIWPDAIDYFLADSIDSDVDIDDEDDDVEME